MYYEDNRVKDLKVAYIRRWFPWVGVGFMMDLAADARWKAPCAV